MTASFWSPTTITAHWALTAPILIVAAAGLVAMLTDGFSANKRVTAWVALAGLLAAAASCVGLWGNNAPPTFALIGQPPSGQLVADNFALVLDLIFIGAGVLTILMSLDYLQGQRLMRGEFFILLLFAVSGMMLMVHATELITIFVALEAFSVSLYVLSAFARRRKRSAEAGLKYLLLGAFSSAFFLYGIALIYGSLGTTNLFEISRALATVPAGAPGYAHFVLPAGIGLLLVGLGFKVAAVPFHVWTPDVYEGAPTPVTAFMSVATKAAAFGAMARILLYAFPSAQAQWGPLVAAMSVATMVVGNFVAVQQHNVKRLLAYSSIAHAGYLLITIAGRDAQGMIFYLLCYAVMNMGAFAVVAGLAHDGRELNEITDFRGLAHRNRPAALAMSAFMFSLAGIPFAIGYYGKAVIFLNAVQGHLGLVIVGVLTSAVSAYYYLRVVVAMWMRPHDEAAEPVPARSGSGVGFVMALCAVLTIVLGLAVNPFLKLSLDATPAESPGMAQTTSTVAQR